MAPPPQPVPGDYFFTNPSGRSVCKAYTAPPRIRGQYICTIAKGTYLGPVTAVESTADYVTIEVRGYWINIYAKINNAHFARRVRRICVQHWVQWGWHHGHEEPVEEPPDRPAANHVGTQSCALAAGTAEAVKSPAHFQDKRVLASWTPAADLCDQYMPGLRGRADPGAHECVRRGLGLGSEVDFR